MTKVTCIFVLAALLAIRKLCIKLDSKNCFEYATALYGNEAGCVGAIFRVSDQGAYWSAAPPTTTSTKPAARKQSTLGDCGTHGVFISIVHKTLLVSRAWTGCFQRPASGLGCRRGPRSPWPWPRPACARVRCAAAAAAEPPPSSPSLAFVCRANKGQICGSRYSCSSACCRVNNAVESIWK